MVNEIDKEFDALEIYMKEWIENETKIQLERFKFRFFNDCYGVVLFNRTWESLYPFPTFKVWYMYHIMYKAAHREVMDRIDDIKNAQMPSSFFSSNPNNEV